MIHFYFQFCQLREDMFKSNMACCFIIWLLVVCCQTIMLPRCMKLLVALAFTTVVLCAALTLVMAEEFMHLPSALQRMSSVLVQNRFRRTMFICAVVGLICFSSTLSLVSIFTVNKLSLIIMKHVRKVSHMEAISQNFTQNHAVPSAFIV